MRSLLIILLVLAPFALAQMPDETAALVNAETIDAAKLATAIKAADPLTRATAARVALVRDVASLVPAVREALAAETNAETAREQVRALVILGSDDDVAFAASQLARFPAGIDFAFTDAVARIGAPRAIDLFLRHRPSLRRKGFPFANALWGRGELAGVSASRLLATDDGDAWRSVLESFIAADKPLPDGLLHAALGSNNTSIREQTLWHVARHYADEPQTFPQLLRESARMDREDQRVSEAFARELVRRMLGVNATEKPEWTQWLGDRAADMLVQGDALQKLLTKTEQRALDKGDPPMAPTPSKRSAVESFSPPAFSVPLLTPPGLAQQLLASLKCRAGWIGLPPLTVDRAGRVQSVDVSRVKADAPCREVLQTLLRLSLAETVSYDAPLSTNAMLVVKPPAELGCLGDLPVDDEAPAAKARITGPDVRAPKVTRRVEPVFPESVRKRSGGQTMIVVLESVITRTGCVRDIRLITPTSFPELNTSAAISLSQWRFEPGTLDGKPVDVIFHVVMSYRKH